MKKWQIFDLLGKALILFASLLHFFWIPGFSSFKLEQFWYDTMDNQLGIGHLLLGKLTEDGKDHLYNQLMKNSAAVHKFGEDHILIQNISFFAFGAMFLIGSLMLIYARFSELSDQNKMKE